MMASMSALEFREWQAYELATGPLDRAYEREMLAEIHELIQQNSQLTGAAIPRKGKGNPAGKMRRAIRADRWFLGLDEEESTAEDLDDDYDGDPDEGYEGDDSELEFTVDPNSYDPAKDPFANM